MKELVGRFTVSVAGHDKGRLYVILAAEDGDVYLCDGKYHTPENLKKKSLKHIQICKDTVDEDLLRRIKEKDKLFSHEIKYAIKMQEKGKEEGYVKE